MNNEFENALAWFHTAPLDWIESGRKNLAAGAEWIYEVIQGDFNENQSTAQVITGTVISMIPFVDQVCDVRDLAANCKRIKDEPSQMGNWFSLVLTLIGLFPTLGSLAKGCLKVAFASARKAGAVTGATRQLDRVIDGCVLQLNRFFSRPEIVKTLKVLNWDNPYRILAQEARKVAAKLNVAALLNAFDGAARAIESMLSLVKRWGGDALASKACDLLDTVDEVRRMADRQIGSVLKGVQTFLDRLARRLEIEADMAHRAYLDSVNPHAFLKVTEPETVASFKRELPKWVDNTGRLKYDKVRTAPPAPTGWTSTAPDPKRGRHPLDNAHETFHTMEPMTIPPGTTLYRIVDPTSKDNSICWMTEAEFLSLKTKDDWRRRFAVWAHWNANGEFVTYKVPPGPGLNVWEGVTASQQLKGTNYVLEGGARQIVLDPSHLDKTYLSARKKTGWGYDELGTKNDFVGVPVQTNYWYEKEDR